MELNFHPVISVLGRFQNLLSRYVYHHWSALRNNKATIRQAVQHPACEYRSVKVTSACPTLRFFILLYKYKNSVL